MKILSNGSVLIALGIALVAGIAVSISINIPTAAQGPPAATSGRYRVVETDGMSLIVTDNQKNMLYFYTVNQGDKPGADLHLRGTVDLNSVGQDTIKPNLLTPKK
jgi:hypothetical protein